MSNNIWMCGIPGSKWSGIDIEIRNQFDVDRTDETPERVFYHSAPTKENPVNGHRGSYWGPGMGCGENWKDFNNLTPDIIKYDIDQVFSGNMPRVIKSHFLARHFNLDYVYNNFPGDTILLIYREPQKSFAWWCEVMDFSEGHYPDYRPGYSDYNTMRDLLFLENAKILDFAMKKSAQWTKYSPDVISYLLPTLNTCNNPGTRNPGDVYVTTIDIPK